MTESRNDRSKARLPVWVVLLAFLLIGGGAAWVIWRQVFAEETRTVSIETESPASPQANPPSHPDAPVAPAPSPWGVRPNPPAPAKAASEDMAQKRRRLGIETRRIVLSEVPEGVTDIGTLRLIAGDVEVDASKLTGGNKLFLNCSPMPPGGPADSEKGLIRRGVELAGGDAAAEKQVAIESNQFYTLLVRAVQARRSIPLWPIPTGAPADPFAAHMADYFQKWNGSDAAGRIPIEADWLAAVRTEGGERLKKLDAQVAGDFDNAVAALTDPQKQALIALAKANPPTQPTTRAAADMIVRLPAARDGLPRTFTLKDGVWNSQRVDVCSGKLLVSYYIDYSGKSDAAFIARVPPAVSADWIRIDNGITDLLRIGALAKELRVSDEQLAKLQTLPPRLDGAITLPDADRDLINRAIADYLASAAADRPAKSDALLKTVRDIGERAYEPFMQEQQRRDAAIEFILTAEQLNALKALMKDTIVVQ